MKKEKKIIISKNGPYLVSGNIPLIKETAEVKNNVPDKWKKIKNFPSQENYALCRCGGSKNKPFCDGSHINNFDGKETAKNIPYLKNSETTEGPELILTDNTEFCSLARFCNKREGTWNSTEKSNDSKSKKLAIETACNCPSGRLVVWDKKTKKPIEPKFPACISVTEDPQADVSGPLWIKGGVLLESSSGKVYEKRNRITLCRCGGSKNKPFCDGSHIDIGFNDTNKGKRI